MNNPVTLNDASDRAFLGHPVGLAYISFTEAWERFSYYGMQTLLVLYMVNQLLLPGHIENIAGFTAFRWFVEHLYGKELSVVALSSAIFGLYSGFVYLTPIAGGFIADRLLGKTSTIVVGALLMSAGHFLMAFDFSFLIALLCLLTGVGCFKGNLASQVSALYAATDNRRADAFQIYYLFINAAVIISPLVCGTLGEKMGWHYGFGAAGVGMLISLVIYLSGKKWLPKEDAKAVKSAESAAPVVKAPLSKKERNAIVVLLFLLPVLAVGSIGNQEIFNAYLLWVPQHIDLVFFGQVMPTTWLITLDATVSVSALVLSLLFWRWWAKRFPEPTEIYKMTIGLVLGTLGLVALGIAGLISANGQKAGIEWVLAFEFLNAFGFANLFPVGLALYARSAPKAVAGTMMGVYYLNLFMCNNLVGWLGGLVERMSGAQFWFLHVALVGGSALVMFVIARLFGKYLLPDELATSP
ncbi:peptide MFS transporter [Sapientia aquatica]|uniref:MFS transporter n=1 Tax=Sapientia aquatica TaxID=1549640 RepID=A0A4V6PMK4_9BURK|nr:peptide MFS transporter [Sapientia aquatica]TDK68266.1 MFS transporter [Sapientia aquatica]